MPSYTRAGDVTLVHTVVGPLGMSGRTSSASKGGVRNYMSMVLITAFKTPPRERQRQKMSVSNRE